MDERLERLRELFPAAFAASSDPLGPRWKVDIDSLRELLGEYVSDSDERFSLSWKGKANSRRIAGSLPTGTLHPCRDESVNWDTTGNLFVEGDNLEVLKLLQRSHQRRVKLIYIDPPYNTGTDRIYADNFRRASRSEQRSSEQRSSEQRSSEQHTCEQHTCVPADREGCRPSDHCDQSGLYHTDWLNMIYPRLAIAKNLLRDDGVIFISIDDNEFANLRKVCDEIFGSDNFCGVFIWEKKKKPSFLNANMGTVTDYIVCYAKHRPNSPPFTAGQVEDGKKYPFNNAGNPLQTLAFPAGSVRFSCGDQLVPKQDMSAGSIVTELLDDVVILDGTNESEFRLRGQWRYSQRKLDEFVNANAEIVIAKVPFRPNYVNRSGAPKKTSNLLSHRTNDVPTNEDATAEIRRLFGSDVMSHPKPSGLMKYLVRAVTGHGDIVMDFFAGSCSTAHGMWLQSIEDGQRRQFIGVQLAETLDRTSNETSQRAVAFCRQHGLPTTIAEIGKERLRRTIAELSGDERSDAAVDLGFQVYKLEFDSEAEAD